MEKNKDKAYSILSQDSECLDRDYSSEKETFITNLKKSDVEYKKDLHCCLCGHKSVWGVKPECDNHPEWSYWCSNCDIKLIMLCEKD